jgi:aminocarboxymuconate-semialdehyde decarboxylase
MLDGLKVIDLHHHFIPQGVLAELRRQAGGKDRLKTDLLSIGLNPVLGDIAAHLAVMDEARIDAAVLSYSGLSVLGIGVCREINNALFELQSEHRDVFYATAHVDLSDSKTAIVELRRCAQELGMRAVALPTSMPSLQLDDESLRPLWGIIEELGLPVILHPALLPTGASTDYALERSCARPFDTTTAVVRVMLGVLPHFPTIRFVAPHCGGTAPYLKGRIQMFFTAPGAMQRALPRTQRELHAEGLIEVFEKLWTQIYVDTAGNGGWTPITRTALDVVSTERVCFGSEFPLEAHDSATMGELVDALGSLDLDRKDLLAVMSGNAAGLLHLETSTPE